MKKFYIFMILLVSCFSYDYYVRTYYRPRYATNSLSRLQTPFEKTLFGRKPFGRTPFRNRLRKRVYRENYYRHRLFHTPAAWLRQINEVRTEIPKHPNYSLSDFGFIKNGQNNAEQVINMENRTWIARVLPTYTQPMSTRMVCTAACVQERIFITAAICINSVKLVYTRVFYQDQALPPIAFVLPSNQTKQMFDDIGIIVVDSHTFNGIWKTVTISPTWSNGRPDDQFIWHAKPLKWHEGIAVGYVDVDEERIRHPESFEITRDEVKYTLYELKVEVSNFLCNYIFNEKTPNDAYFVPCYSTCNLVDYYQNLPKCYTYLSGLGHAVIWKEWETLIGVATWGGYYTKGTEKPPLPIGLAISNSPNFYQDFACAKMIRDAPNTTERFVTLCDTRI